MLQTNANYQTYNNALAKKPVYVAEIFFNGGNTGVDGINDVYFATCDVNDITGFAHPERWFPVLKANSIGSMSQTVDPINGVSSIGNLSLQVVDYNGLISDIIKAADEQGHGFRRQRINICMMFKGMAWADKIIVRTMQINDLKLSNLNEYTITAADVQRQLTRTIFNPQTTTTTMAIATTGAITLTVYDARDFIATAQQGYGTSGFIKIDDEIMRWTAKTDGSFTIDAADRGRFLSVAATHDSGVKVSEIIVLNENPITMALKIMQSTGTGANGTWDAYPARWGCAMDSANDVNVDEWLEIGKLLVGLGLNANSQAKTPESSDGTQFEFVLDKGVEAKKFIEDEILKILGAFGFVHGDGRYGIRAYADLSNAAKENATITADENSVIKWGDLSYNYNDLTNQVWIEYDEPVKLSGKYIRSTIFIDPVSIKKWGEAKQLKYSAAGIIATTAFASQLYQRFQRIVARYSRPPMQIDLTLMPKFHTLEIGDLVRVTLPIRDLFTGANIDRAFEVLSTQLKVDTGEIVIKCLAQPEAATFWFGGVGEVYSVTISPAVANIVTGTTQQLTARSFDGLGNQVPTPSIAWIASGNVSVDSSGLVTAGAVGTGTVQAVVGTKQSNTSTITVTATANTNTVASVTVSPSVVTLEAPQTQVLTAQAKDVSGNQVNAKTFTWSSSDTGVATVPAGPSVSATVTAVANGTANIVAQETVTAINSAAVVVTVATPATPPFEPPDVLDSAYQVGTQITAHGPVGGPHVIPDAYNFLSGDYWYDGDVSLAISTTCTINGTVRIFSLGNITINGTINGKGRGVAGAAAVSVLFNGESVQANGISGTVRGFCGNGGNGGAGYYGLGTSALGGTGAAAFNATSPTLNLSSSAVSGASWPDVTGIPSTLYGSQAASGGALTEAYSAGYGTAQSGAGGASGAGVVLCGRGLLITIGTVDLRGNDGSAGTWFGVDDYAGGGGGGGGGSFIGIVQKQNEGLPAMNILESKILMTGGAGGIGKVANGVTGGTGVFIPKIIG